MRRGGRAGHPEWRVTVGQNGQEARGTRQSTGAAPRRPPAPPGAAALALPRWRRAWAPPPERLDRASEAPVAARSTAPADRRVTGVACGVLAYLWDHGDPYVFPTEVAEHRKHAVPVVR
jgi:hypothetical protein